MTNTAEKDIIKLNRYLGPGRIFCFVFFLAFFLFLFGCTDSYPVADINHIVHLGQSLAAGEHSLPVVTDSATGFGNLSFKIGTHTWTRNYFEGRPEERDSSFFTFIPLRAHERGHEGETIANGMCDHIKSTSETYMNHEERFLFSYSGQGGRLIRELDKAHDEAKDPRAGESRSGGGYYKTVIDDIKRAKLQADADSLTYSVFAITWMQGESNISGHINRWDKPLKRDSLIITYREDLIRLKKDLQKDVQLLTKQKHAPAFFSYQTSATTIGGAQLMAADMEEDIYMVGPTYMLPSADNSRIWQSEMHGAGIHITADGERWLGEMFGKVIRKVVFEKIKWQPLRPMHAWLNEDKKSLDIKFHVPVKPIVIDTLFLPKQGSGFGIEIYDRAKSYKIKSATVIKNNIVRVWMDEQLVDTVDYFIRYGVNNYAGDVSVRILSVGKYDSVIRGIPHISLEFPGNILQEFSSLASEGAFILATREGPEGRASSIIIREMVLNNTGNTVLLGERGDIEGGPFSEDQKCYLLRRYNYGNIRDSDTEQSVFRYGDQRYGRRFGQHYPLFNWSVIFEDFKVINKRMKGK